METPTAAEPDDDSSEVSPDDESARYIKRMQKKEEETEKVGQGSLTGDENQ